MRTPFYLITKSLTILGLFLAVSGAYSQQKPDTLDEIRKKISGNKLLITQERPSDAPGMCSMGIANTVMRLKLLYGEELSFDISSNEEFGTTVSISGPVKAQVSSLEL